MLHLNVIEDTTIVVAKWFQHISHLDFMDAHIYIYIANFIIATILTLDKFLIISVVACSRI
jgi:hypothetical protein